MSALQRVARRVLAGALLSSLLLSPLARAHEEAAGQIQVEHPWALPAAPGASTQLYMTIRNEASRPVHFFGLTTPVAAASRIMFASPGKTGTLQSVTIQAEGTLGLGTSHMWIELSGLTSALRVGQSFPAELAFTGFTLGISVIVEERRSPSGAGAHG